MATAINSQDQDNFIVFGAVTTFRYTNWKGETSMRTVIPTCLRFGTSPHHPAGNDPSVHPDEQGGGVWLLECVDLDKLEEGVFRTFALANIHPR